MDPELEINQQVTSLVDDLDKLTPDNTEIDDKNISKTPFSNDRKVAHVIPQLKERMRAIPKKEDGIKVGVVIASGGLLSLGKEFPEIDLWIVLDSSPRLIDTVKQYFKLVSTATTTNELLAIYEKYKNDCPEKESYGKYHYLENQENLEQAQKFLSLRRGVS